MPFPTRIISVGGLSMFHIQDFKNDTSGSSFEVGYDSPVPTDQAINQFGFLQLIIIGSYPHSIDFLKALSAVQLYFKKDKNNKTKTTELIALETAYKISLPLKINELHYVYKLLNQSAGGKKNSGLYDIIKNLFNTNNHLTLSPFKDIEKYSDLVRKRNSRFSREDKMTGVYVMNPLEQVRDSIDHVRDIKKRLEEIASLFDAMIINEKIKGVKTFKSLKTVIDNVFDLTNKSDAYAVYFSLIAEELYEAIKENRWETLFQAADLLKLANSLQSDRLIAVAVGFVIAALIVALAPFVLHIPAATLALHWLAIKHMSMMTELAAVVGGAMGGLITWGLFNRLGSEYYAQHKAIKRYATYAKRLDNAENFMDFENVSQETNEKIKDLMSEFDPPPCPVKTN